MQKSHTECPYIDCGSSDAFSYNTKDQVGYCFSCDQAYPNTKLEMYDWAKERYPFTPKSKKEAGQSLKNLTPAKVTYEGIRGLDPDVAKFYGIQLHLAEDGTPLRYAFKYPENVKYRDMSPPGKDKQITMKESGKPILSLFGPNFNAGSSKKLYITEGEFDAASLYQVLDKTFPVVSLASSSFSDEYLKHNYHYLNAFKELIYAGELDKAGKKAADRLFKVFPEKFYFVHLTKYKDANDFLTNGAANDLKWAALKPQRYAPDNFFCTDKDVEHAITTENPYQYIPTGHTGIDGHLRGLVKSGITFIKAPRGTGKTEIARYFEYSVLKNSVSRVGILHMEEQKSTTYRSFATYELGVNVRTKDDAKWNSVDESQVIEAAKRITQGERTVVFEMRSHDDPLDILDHIKLLATVYGVDFVFVDHVQRLAYLSQAGVDGATSALTTLASRSAQLAKELNIGIIFLSQVNDDGRTKYAAALEEEAIICIKLERDTETEDEVEKNTTHFIIDKNRPFSKLGRAGSIYYDPQTTILREEF